MGEWLESIRAAIPFTGKEFHEFYAHSMRGSLFTGFLTLSGFLFSVNTFIVVNMKKELYDHVSYFEKVTRLQGVNPNLTFYGPLRRLSRLLLAAVVCSVFASLIQFTIGLIPRWYTAVACILFAIVAITVLAVVLWVIRQNLAELFEFLEDEAKKKANPSPPSAGGTTS